METTFDPLKYGAVTKDSSGTTTQSNISDFSGGNTGPVKTQESLITNPFEIFGKTILSMPRSTWDFGKNIIAALYPLQDTFTKPRIKAWENIKQLPEAFKETSEAASAAGWSRDQTGKEFMKSYRETVYKGFVPKSAQQIIKGEFTEAANTMANDPVGEIYPWLMLAKYGFDKAGKGEQFDKAIQTIASPVTKPAAFVGQKIGEFAGKAASTITGLTTGKGEASVREAYKNTPEYKAALKGETTPKDVVNVAKGAVENLKEQRRLEYTENLSKLPTDKVVNISPIRAELIKQLERFKITIDKNGKLDFSKSSIRNDTAAVGDIKTVYEDITNWTDFSPTGVDSLKQGVSQVYSNTARSKPFVAAMTKSISSNLKSQIPEYSKLTQGYEEMSSLLDDLKGLSLGGKANPDTIFSKLTSAMKGNNALKEQLIQELQAQGQQNIMGSVAGVEMSQWTSGYLRSAIAGTSLLNGFQAADLLVLAATSPRVVAAFASALGIANTQVEKFTKFLGAYRDFYGIGIIKENGK